MEKYLTYSVILRNEPGVSGSGVKKYYGRTQARGVAGIRELSKRIQQMCTVTRADVMAVLIALEDVVAEALSNGEIVRLGELGSLQVSLSSKGVDKKDSFNETLFTTKRILFRSGQTLSNMLSTIKYEEVPQKYSSNGEDPEKTEEGDAGKAEEDAGMTEDEGGMTDDEGVGPKGDEDAGMTEEEGDGPKGDKTSEDEAGLGV